MNKALRDAEMMMRLYPNGWAFRVKDLQKHFPDSDYACQVLGLMMELSQPQETDASSGEKS